MKIRVLYKTDAHARMHTSCNRFKLATHMLSQVPVRSCRNEQVRNEQYSKLQLRILKTVELIIELSYVALAPGAQHSSKDLSCSRYV